ncbi:MAG: efflux RND transporter periplasmic adaptor subunit [Thermoguttaceae bacterium]
MRCRGWKLLLAAVLLTSPCWVGCTRQPSAASPPAPETAVVTVESRPVVLTAELPGRTSAYLVAEIRPQVNGLIQKRLFTEGSQVKAGQILYEIDPAPYKAAYDNAAANLESSRQAVERAKSTLAASIAALKRHQAILKLAKTNLRRYDNLLETKAVSAMQRDQAVSDVDVADAGLKVAEAQVNSDQKTIGLSEAAVKQMEAALQTAKINLDYTKITAPISGRIGRSNVTVGAIATAYQPQSLATIQQLDPIFVDVPQSTVELNRLKHSLAAGRLKENGTDTVKIELEDGTAYPQDGSLKFHDVTVDPTTGSVILRVVVPNPDSFLLPGMFVRAVIDQGVNQHAILVPQQAVARDQKGNPYVLVVDAEGKAQPRPVVTDRAIGDQWLISSGLAPGERVIVEGMLRVRPGMVVRAVPFKGTGQPSPADSLTKAPKTTQSK